VIPTARSRREIPVDIPVHTSPPEFISHEMAVDGTHDHGHARSTTSVIAQVDSDGLLLYVSQASYEEGTSPLSCWIPSKPLTESPEPPTGFEGDGSLLDVFQRCVCPFHHVFQYSILNIYQPGSAAHSEEYSWESYARLDGHIDITNCHSFIIWT
jgi:hypothetical protein